MMEILELAKMMIGILAAPAYKKMERNHKLLNMIKKLRMGKLKDDFQSIYAHALVEYTVDAVPVELVYLFAIKTVKKAFQDGLYKNGGKEFNAIIEHEFDNNNKLAFLKNIYASTAELEPEIDRFREWIEYFTLQTGNAFQLKKYNEDKAYQLEMLEEKQRKSFDYQAEQYLIRLKEDFQKEFLEGNTFHKGKLFIDLHAETRIMRMEKPDKPGEKRLKKELEKDSEGEPEESAYDTIPHRPMDTYINQWLKNETANFLIIIGEYGTGKTTFMRRLAHQLASNRLEPGSGKAMADPDGRLPLLFPLRDFEKTMESYIVHRLNVEGITDIDYSRFLNLLKNNECILLLDGFDEMTQKIDADEKAANFARIRNLIESGNKSKIILTTRQEYFQSSAELYEVFKHKDKKNYSIIHLLPFDDDQIQHYLKTHMDNPDFYWRQIKEIFDLQDLARRPVLLELIVCYLPQLIKEKGEGERIHASDLYDRCIQDELNRKRDELKFRVPPKHRLKILQKLAVWLFSTDALSFDTGLLETELNLRQYFRTERDWEFEKHLNEFLTFTFLIRESDYRYRMSHKSFRDYLTAGAFVQEVNTGKIQFFARTRLTEEVSHFMREQVLDKESLLKLVLTARDLTEETQWQGTNAANLLLQMDKAILKGRDLSRCQLPYVNFRGCDLSGVTFKDSNLSNCRFNHKSIISAHVSGANFENAMLELFNEGIEDISFLNDFGNLSTLYLPFNKIIDISPLQRLHNLDSLNLLSNQISDISVLAGLTHLNVLNLGFMQISDISVLAGLTHLNVLNLSATQISDISVLAGLTHLNVLNLGFMQISDISVLAGLTHLNDLDLSFTQISDISALAGLTHLNQLDLRSTQISDISVLAGLTHLNQLNLSATQISDISVLAVLTHLNELGLSSTQISDISVLAGLTKLNYLNLSSTQISDISVLADLTKLNYLNLSTTHISDISVLAGLTHLNRLYLSSTQISDISVLAGLTHLNVLNLSTTQISDISVLAGLTHLNDLDLSSTQISDISVLAGLTHLNVLHLSATQISDISALAGLTHLNELYLGSTQISDISALLELKNLRMLFLSKNQVPAAQLTAIKEAIPGIVIYEE